MYGQLDTSSSVIASTSKLFHTTMPVKGSQFSSATMNGLQSSVMHSDHVNSAMSSLTSQFTGLVTSFYSSVSSPSKPTMVKPSEQVTSTITPKLTKAIIQPQTPSAFVKMTSPDVSVSKPLITTTKSTSASPVPETLSYNNDSSILVLPTLTDSLNNRQSSTASILITTSDMMLSPSFNVASLGTSLSSFRPTLIPVNTNSSHVMPYSTSSMKFSQTAVTTVLPNRSSSTVKLDISISSAFILHESSVKSKTNITNLSTMNSTSTSKVVITSYFLSTSTSYSVVPSVSVTSQSAQSMLNPTSVDVSPTLAVKSSCSNGNCITLQPSATITQIRNRTVISSSLTTFQSRSTSTFSPSSNSVVSTMVHYKPTNVTQDKEKSHTSLIIGLAVGLSVVLIVVIVVIVCYRRRRSSYQYNVFYDEQNIVMHPFDYSK